MKNSDHNIRRSFAYNMYRKSDGGQERRRLDRNKNWKYATDRCRRCSDEREFDWRLMDKLENTAATDQQLQKQNEYADMTGVFR